MYLSRSSELKKLNNAKKVERGPTDQPTDIMVCSRIAGAVRKGWARAVIPKPLTIQQVRMGGQRRTSPIHNLPNPTNIYARTIELQHLENVTDRPTD